VCVLRVESGSPLVVNNYNYAEAFIRSKCGDSKQKNERE